MGMVVTSPVVLETIFDISAQQVNASEILQGKLAQEAFLGPIHLYPVSDSKFTQSVVGASFQN
jgi:hypothetical protein